MGGPLGVNYCHNRENAGQAFIRPTLGVAPVEVVD